MSSESEIEARFRATHPRSAALHAQAAEIFPSGVTHDIRHFQPFPIYIDRASGPYKWDADGHQIIDYVMGHGALLLGHAYPSLVAAVQTQISQGTHYGASHALEMGWAQAVQQLLPSAEKVRFTSSGTEATMMAIRLARAYTGRERILKLRNHFHGWSDSLAAGARNTAGAVSTAGLPASLHQTVVIVDQHDTDAMRRELQRGDVAAVILEPTGASWGANPLPAAVLPFLRAQTAATETVLIFDEVITGFRASPGGMQEAVGIRPDLTTLAKILGGGLPGGAVAGRRAILDQIAFPPQGTANGARVSHPGTFNANPLSAVAGTAALREVATGAPTDTANARARRLTEGLNRVIRRREVAGAAYARYSMVHIVLGVETDPPGDDLEWVWGTDGPGANAPATPEPIVWPFRQAMVERGVDLMGMGAMVSSVHGEAEIDATIEAFDGALGALDAAALL